MNHVRGQPAYSQDRGTPEVTANALDVVATDELLRSVVFSRADMTGDPIPNNMSPNEWRRGVHPREAQNPLAKGMPKLLQSQSASMSSQITILGGLDRA